MIYLELSLFFALAALCAFLWLRMRQLEQENEGLKNQHELDVQVINEQGKRLLIQDQNYLREKRADSILDVEIIL